MGGKTKQSQRTKNNVRPSSSSRSAGLLTSGVNLDGGLVTLSSGKTLPQIFPTLAATNLEQGLNPEFQMCIKKLNKKDPITRAKALQELCELVNSADINDVVAALPSWAHFYKILSADTDRKVRELTQVCHGSVVRVCGRRVAPQLKALLPAWLAAQHDAHAPAQAAAAHALKSTFPDSKLPEVITFCKAEVMVHLLDNLIGNAETVITKRIENAEDRELQMNRIITSSLQGLEYFVEHLPGEHDAWLWTELTPLLQAAAFWKLAQSAHQVRGAWYAAMGRVAARFADTFGAAHGGRLARALLAGAPHALHASHAQALWACLLQLLHHAQNWPAYLDNKELLVKRILDVLENGGWGDARHLSNMLLPLLAHLPQDLLTKEFYDSFFKAMFSGLDKKTILNSKSERQTWITSLAECLRYLSIQERAFVTEISTSVHRHWIERVLSTQQDGQTRTNLIKWSAINMASLVKYWLKQSKEGNNEKYDQLVRNFWQNVGSSVLTQIDKSSSDEKDIEKVIEGHILLLQTLKTAFAQDSKKQLSIKFDGDEPTPGERVAPLSSQCDAAVADRYKHNLDECVHTICSHYFERAEKEQLADPILTALLTLLNEFDSKNLFTAVARQFDVDSVYKLYEKVLRPWLSSDSMCSKSVVDIVFLLMKYMTEEEQDAMFESFNQVGPETLEWCLAVSARHPAVRAAAARRWLRGASVCAALARLARRAAAARPPPAAALLLVCLAGARDDEPLVSEAAVTQVVQTFSEAIAQTDSATLETSAALAARLVSTLQDHGDSDQYSQLVQNLFQLNILVPRGDVRLSLDTWCEVRSSWADGLAALAPAPRMRCLQHAAAFLHRQLGPDTKDLDISKIENVLSPCAELVWVGAGTEGAARASRLVLARPRRAPEPARAPARAPAAAALRHLCLSAQLCCLHDADDDFINAIVLDASNSDADDLTEAELVPYANEILFRAIYLKTLFLHKISSDDDDNEADQKTWCDTLLQDEYLRDEFCQVLYDYTVIYFLDEGYTFWPHYDIIQQTKQKMDSLLEAVISATGEEMRSAVLATLTERALARGYLWALARRCYVLRAQPAERGPERGALAAGAGSLHTLQANSKWCSDAEAQYRCKFLVMLHSWRAVHAAALEPAELSSAFASAAERCDPDAVLNAYYRHNHTMLYDRDISDVPWNDVLSNVTVVEFLTAMVETRGWDAAAHHWDFTTITMCSLLSSLEKSKRHWACSKVAMLARAVLRLFAAVRRFVRELRAQCTRREPAPHVADLMPEWRDIFAPDTHYSLFTIIVHVLESCTSMQLSAGGQCVVAALGAGAEQLEWEALGAARRAGGLALPGLARAAAAALRRPAAPPAKRLAFRLLQRLAAPLPSGSPAGVTTAPPTTRPSTSDRSSRWTTSTTPSRSCTRSSTWRSAQSCWVRRPANSWRRLTATVWLSAGSCWPRSLRQCANWLVETSTTTTYRYTGSASTWSRCWRRRCGCCRSSCSRSRPTRGPALLRRATATCSSACPTSAPQERARRCRRWRAAACSARCAGPARAARAAGGAPRPPAPRACWSDVCDCDSVCGRSGRGGAGAGVPRRVQRAVRARRGRRARLVGRRARPHRAPAGAAGARLRGAARRAPAAACPAAARRRAGGHGGPHRVVHQRGDLPVHRGGAHHRAARVAVADAPAGAAAHRGRGRLRARRQHALGGAVPRVPERHNPERAEDVDTGGEREGGELPAVLHLLLSPASPHGPLAARALPPVQEQVPQHVSAQMVRNEQQVKLSAVQIDLLMKPGCTHHKSFLLESFTNFVLARASLKSDGMKYDICRYLKEGILVYIIRLLVLERETLGSFSRLLLLL